MVTDVLTELLLGSCVCEIASRHQKAKGRRLVNAGATPTAEGTPVKSPRHTGEQSDHESDAEADTHNDACDRQSEPGDEADSDVSDDDSMDGEDQDATAATGKAGPQAGN